MSRLAYAGLDINCFLRSQGWSCCIVGGIAISRGGEPRATEDVDVCLLTGLGQEKSFLTSLLKQFPARIENAADFAERSRVVLLTASNGVGIDVALAWTPFEERMVTRATPFEYSPGVVLPIPTAED